MRVRIGLHSGRPTLTDAGYTGLVVHAVHRISAEAGGGEIVLSAATLSAVGDERPPSVRFVERGPRQLRGVRDAVVLFAVGAPLRDIG